MRTQAAHSLKELIKSPVPYCLALSPSPDSSWDNRLSSAPLILRLQEKSISTFLVVSADLGVFHRRLQTCFSALLQ